jgi:hypothetical protein
MITLKINKVAIKNGENVDIKGRISETLNELREDRFPDPKKAISTKQRIENTRLSSVEVNGPKNEVMSDSTKFIIYRMIEKTYFLYCGAYLIVARVPHPYVLVGYKKRVECRISNKKATRTRWTLQNRAH